MNSVEFIENIKDVNFRIKVIELCIIILFSFFIFGKINNEKINQRNRVIILFIVPIIAIVTRFIRFNIRVYLSWIVAVFLLIIVNKIIFKKEIEYTILTTIISLSISYILYVFSVMLAFFPNIIFNIQNDYISLIVISSIYLIITYKTFKIKRLKYGLSFLKEKLENSFFSIIIITVCSITLLSLVVFQSHIGTDFAKSGTIFVVFSVVMFIIIRKLINLYYKQKLLVKDLEQTKSELEAKKKEIDKLEKENLEFSKTSHSLAHKQKSLEYKLEKLMKTNVDSKDKESIQKEIQSISKEIYKEPQQLDLPKTEIEAIDDMFAYMQAECIKNKIKFELQVEGNIFYMINHLISENELEILIADHIKDAIIAINHSNNSNKSILVRIGKIDGIYSLYIYDSGIEFEKEVLENLGKKPITTHTDTGGTGMGFMNTFDTLNRTKASLIINEIGKPCIDNYTKVVIFKFDNNNEFEVESYRNEVVVI